MNMYAQATYAAIWHQVQANKRKEQEMADMFGAKANQCLDQCMQQALQSFRKTA